MSVAPLAFKAEALNLGKLLSGSRSFAIPIFQRSYSWTAREVGQLMADLWFGIEEARPSRENYGGLFLGSLVVVDEALEAVSSERPIQPEAYQVIDGKQRLTTLTIILAALRDRLGASVAWIDDLLSHVEDPASDTLRAARLTLGLEEGTYFDVQVQRPGATQMPVEPDADHQGRRGIRECQLTVTGDFDDRSDEDLAELATFLRDRVVLVLISAPDIDIGFRVFLTTNHRGKPLSQTDILKAELMAEVPQDQRERSLERWRITETLLAGDFGQLPGYLHTLHGSSHGAHIRGVLELSRRQGGAQRFLNDTLFPVAEALYPILNASHMGSPQSEAINRSLRLLGWLKARDWVPPALAFTERYPDQPELLAAFLAALERLAFGMQIAGVGGDQREQRYRAVIESLNDPAALDGTTGPLALSAEDQGALLLKANGGLYRRSAATCKYLLKRISASYPGDVVMESLSDVSVEHVLPTNPADNSPWLREIPDSAERVACNKLLGNLVLVSRQQNKEARNQGLDAKLRVYFPGGKPSPHAITNLLIGARSWNAVDIRAREGLLVERIREIAGIPEKIVPARRKKTKLA